MNKVAENVNVEDQAEDDGKEVGIPADIVEAFDAGIEGEKEEDAILIDMLQAGSPFSKVRGYFNKLMIENGLALSKEDKESILSDALDGVDISTEEGFDSAVGAVNKAINTTDERGAAQMVRAYARKSEIEYYKKPKGVGGTRTTFISDFYAALVGNPQMTEKEAHDLIVEKGSANTLRWEKTHQKVRVLANQIAEKYAS